MEFKKPKHRFSFKREKKPDEIYCYICKHSLTDHTYKKESAGCARCGCLMTRDEISNSNIKSEVQTKQVEQIMCNCRHSQLAHKKGVLYCEARGCFCGSFNEVEKNE